jgi:hypothetical protein
MYGLINNHQFVDFDSNLYARSSGEVQLPQSDEIDGFDGYPEDVDDDEVLEIEDSNDTRFDSPKEDLQATELEEELELSDTYVVEIADSELSESWEPQIVE